MYLLCEILNRGVCHPSVPGFCPKSTAQQAEYTPGPKGASMCLAFSRGPCAGLCSVAARRSCNIWPWARAERRHHCRRSGGSWAEL